MFRLDGKTAVVTGAASGIGAATANWLARAGANVVVGWTSRDPHGVEAIVDAIEAAGGSALAVDADVSSAADVDRLFSAAADRFERIDIAVANAGISRRVESELLEDDEWHQLLDINLLGVFRCFRAALPYIERHDHGRLLATASISGHVTGWAQHAHYSASKAGIAGLVRTLALEWGGRGITVNAVAPGVIVSPQSLDPVHSMGRQAVAEFASRVPVGRNGTPEDVAALFVFLASDEASFITGQTMVVDGGTTLSLS